MNTAKGWEICLMQKIIALDIGSYSIKAIEILNKFKSYEVSNVYEKMIPHVEEEDPTLVATTLRTLFDENEIQADRIITAMPGQYISSRIMNFNFSDPHKIEAAVFSEIEDIVPFNLDDMIIDQQILGTVDKRTFTLVVLTKKEFVGNFLDTLKGIGIDPKLVDVDSLSFYNLCTFLEMEKSKVYGIVDIGHEKTSICLVENNVLRMFRSINLGGRYITEFIARDMQVTYAEAEALKHEVGLILTEDYPMDNLDAQTLQVAERITLGVKSIARELGRTLYAFKTWEKSPVERIFVSGGTSKIKNLENYLSNQLSLETVIMNLGNSELQYKPQLTEHLPIMSQGISIGIRAVVGAKRNSQINLRKGPYAYVQDYASILNTGAVISKVIALALLLLCLGYGFKYYFYNKEIQQVQTTYLKELSSIPESKKRVKTKNVPFSKIHKDAIKLIDNRVAMKSQAFDDFVRANEDSGALASLQEISQALPKDVTIDVMDFDYATRPDGSGLLKLRIEADSFETIDKFRGHLEKIQVFYDVKQVSSDTKPGTDIKIAVFETAYESNS